MDATELMVLFVLEYKVCSMEYFMDKMSFYEVRTLAKNLHRSVRWGWEMTREIAFVTAQVNSTKRLKPSDIMQFEWDNNKKNEQHLDKERLQELAAKMKMKN